MRIPWLPMVLLLAPAIAGAQTETNLLTIFGQVSMPDGEAPHAGDVLILSIVHADRTRDALSHTFAGTDLGLYALAFIDYDGDNMVAAAGDLVEAEGRTPQGERIGETVREFVPPDAVVSHLFRMDVSLVPLAARPATWGGIKALYGPR